MKTVILIHGIGEQYSDWHKDASRLFPPDVSHVVPFHWYDLLDNASGAKRVRWISALIKKASAGVWWGFALDFVIGWLLNRAGDLLGYPSIRYKAFERLDKLIQEQQGDIYLVAHSLGSVLAFEYILTQSPPRVVAFASLGSPLDRNPVKGRVLERTQADGTLPIKWLNLWGTRDPVVCWTPWRGRMDTFKPDVQKQLKGHAHGLEGYVAAIPPVFWK